MPTGSVSIYIYMQLTGVPVSNIAWSWDRLMFMIGILLVVRRNLYIEMPGISPHVRCLPWTPKLSLCNPAQCNPIQSNPNQSNLILNQSNIKPISNQFNLKSKLIPNQNKSNSILHFKSSLGVVTKPIFSVDVPVLSLISHELIWYVSPKLRYGNTSEM